MGLRSHYWSKLLRNAGRIFGRRCRCSRLRRRSLRGPPSVVGGRFWKLVVLRHAHFTGHEAGDPRGLREPVLVRFLHGLLVQVTRDSDGNARAGRAVSSLSMDTFSGHSTQYALLLAECQALPERVVRSLRLDLIAYPGDGPPAHPVKGGDLRHHAHTILDTAENHGPTALKTWLTSHGYTWHHPPQPPPSPTQLPPLTTPDPHPAPTSPSSPETSGSGVTTDIMGCVTPPCYTLRPSPRTDSECPRHRLSVLRR